jgi:hypothetical protein
MKLSIIFLLYALFFVLPVSAVESITIESPSDSATFSNGGMVPIYIQTSNGSMTSPFIQFSDNLGSWTPTNQINNNEYLKYWNTGELINGSYIISVKTVLEGVDYFDSVTVTIDKPPDQDDSQHIDLNILKVDGLSESTTYNTDDSLWIQIFDNETNTAISEPVINIYNPNLKRTITGTTNGLIKIEWLDLDGEELDTDKYLISIRKDGYKTLDFLVDVENTDTKTIDDTTDENKPTDKMSIYGMDRKIVVNCGSDVFVTDSKNDAIEGVYLKIIDKRTDTVLRTETTNSFGNVYMIWDIVGDYTIGITHPDYKSTSASVTVTNVPVPSTRSTESNVEVIEVITEIEVPAEVTRANVEEFLKNELIDGKPYLDVLKEDAYEEGVTEGKQFNLDEQAQINADKGIVDKIKENATYIIGALGALVLLFGGMRYKSNPLFKEDINKVLSNLKGKIIKGDFDKFDPDKYPDVVPPTTRQEFMPKQSMEQHEREMSRHLEVPTEPETIPSDQTEENQWKCDVLGCNWSGKTETALKAHITRMHKGG